MNEHAPHTKESNRVASLVAGGWAAAILLLFVLAASSYIFGAKASDSLPVVIFFAIPVCMVAKLLIELQKDEGAFAKSASLAGSPILLLLIFWWAFSLAKVGAGDVLFHSIRWGGILLVGFVVVVCVVIVRSLIVADLSEANVVGWGEFFGNHPFQSLVYLASTFLVALLSFSLVLAADDLLSRRSGEESIIGVARVPETGSTLDRGREAGIERLKFDFALELIEFEAGTDVFEFNRSIFLNPEGVERNCPVSESASMAARNTCAILRIIRDAERVQRGFGDVQLVVIGHADDLNLTGRRYASDYELSEARAHQVHTRLLQAMEAGFGHLSPSGIEWLTLPLSNAPVWLEDSSVAAEIPRTLASVEVAVLDVERQAVESGAEARLYSDDSGAGIAPEASSSFEGLMGYIYFSAYTFGTTGYGDFFPVSLFARAVVTMANVLEIFFLAMFLNIVLVRVTRRLSHDTVNDKFGVGRGGSGGSMDTEETVS